MPGRFYGVRPVPVNDKGSHINPVITSTCQMT